MRRVPLSTLLLLTLGALAITNLPDIRRYLRIRAM